MYKKEINKRVVTGSLFFDESRAKSFARGAKKTWIITDGIIFLAVRPAIAEYAFNNGWDLVNHHR